MARMLALVALFVISNVVHADEGEYHKKFLKTLQGEWTAVKVIVGGKSIEEVKKFGLTFQDDTIIPSDNPKDTAKLTLVGTEKPQKIDLKDSQGMLIKGIVEVQGNKLKLCFSEGKDRPAKFEATKDNNAVLIELERKAK